MIETTRIRLYDSALNGVRYVYGHPVKFSRADKDLERRQQDLDAAIAREVARQEALAKAAAKAAPPPSFDGPPPLEPEGRIL
jgi:hypothetical protein